MRAVSRLLSTRWWGTDRLSGPGVGQSADAARTSACATSTPANACEKSGLAGARPAFRSVPPRPIPGSGYFTPPCIACLANSPEGVRVYCQSLINVGPPLRIEAPHHPTDPFTFEILDDRGPIWRRPTGCRHARIAAPAAGRSESAELGGHHRILCRRESEIFLPLGLPRLRPFIGIRMRDVADPLRRDWR